MKTLHWLNKQIAYIMLFLISQSGSGFILLTVFLFDLGTNALGIQVFFSDRLRESITKDLMLSNQVSTAISLIFSVFASAALGLSIMQATLHNKKAKGFVLSIISVIISIAGLIHVGVSVNDYTELLTFANIIVLVMILGLGLTPPIVYDMNAGLVKQIFGVTLQRFNDASTRELEKSFNAQVKDLGEIDKMKTEKQVAKARKSYAPKITSSDGKEIDFNNL